MCQVKKKIWVEPTSKNVVVGQEVEVLKFHMDGGVQKEVRTHRGVITENGGTYGYLDAECWDCYHESLRDHVCRPERIYFFFKESYIRYLDKGRCKDKHEYISLFFGVVFLWWAIYNAIK